MSDSESVLIMLDIDGTLTYENPPKDSYNVREEIRELVEKKDRKFYVGLATARSLSDCFNFYNTIGCNGPVIAEDGSIIYIKPDKTALITEYEKRKIDEISDMLDRELIKREDGIFSQFFREGIDVFRNGKKEAVLSIRAKNHKKETYSQLSMLLNFLYSDNGLTFLDNESSVIGKPGHLNKGKALRYISEKINIENTIAIGDSKNDKELLETARFSFAVGEKAITFAKNGFVEGGPLGTKKILKKIIGGRYLEN